MQMSGLLSIRNFISKCLNAVLKLRIFSNCIVNRRISFIVSLNETNGIIDIIFIIKFYTKSMRCFSRQLYSHSHFHSHSKFYRISLFNLLNLLIFNFAKSVYIFPSDTERELVGSKYVRTKCHVTPATYYVECA